MKNIKIIILLLSLLPLLATAQSRELRRWYKKQEIGDGITKLSLPGWLVRMGINMAGDDDMGEEKEWLKPAVKKLRSIQLLTVEDPEEGRYEHLKNMTMRQADSHKFKPLVSVNSEGTTIRVAMREKVKKRSKIHIIKQLLVLVNSEDELVWCNVRGSWNAKSILSALLDKTGKLQLPKMGGNIFGSK